MKFNIEAIKNKTKELTEDAKKLARKAGMIPGLGVAVMGGAVASPVEEVKQVEDKDAYKNIITDDPNDARLKAYEDSLKLYKGYIFQKNNTIIKTGPQQDVGNINLEDDSFNPVKYDNNEFRKLLKERQELEKGVKEAMKKGDYDNPVFKKLNSFHANNPDFGRSSPIDLNEMRERDSLMDRVILVSNYKQNRKIIDYYRSIGIIDENINFYNSPDIYHPKIKPISEYFDGQAMSPVYKKPTQKIFLEGTPEAEIAKKQIELKKAGFDIDVDGDWGKKSTAAWEAYQKTKSEISVNTKEQKVPEIPKPEIIKIKNAVSFDPEMTNMYSGKGVYLYYDSAGVSHQITKEDYERRRKNGTPEFKP